MANEFVGRTEAGGAREARELEDDRIMSSIRQGDRRAAEELVERTYGMIFGALVRLCHGDADLAADLTQDTYRKAWQSIGRFEGRSGISTWLYRIAYTTFLNHIRTPRRVVALDDAPVMELSDPSPPASDAIVRNDEEKALRRAVLALPEPLQYVVTAHYWAGVSVADIAAHERVTAVAIRKRLGKALDQIETALRKERS